MENKLITVWGSEARAGCKTVSRAMVTQLKEWKRQAIWVRVVPETSTPEELVYSKDPSEWVPRFKSLSPVLLRNFLIGLESSCPQLVIKGYPTASILKDLMILLRQAFEWTFWQASVEWSEEALAVLDNSDLLLWVSRPNDHALDNLRKHFEQLASLHYPNTFSQVVLNQVPESKNHFNQPLEIHPGCEALTHIPQELPRGAAFRQGIQRLLDTLQTRHELYVTRRTIDTTVPAKPQEQVVEEIKNRIKPQLLEALDLSENLNHEIKIANQPAQVAQKTLETCLAEDASLAIGREERTQIYTRVMEEVLGLGPLEPLLKDPNVSEVMVNGKGSIFVEKKGKLHSTGVQFSSDTQLRTIIDRIVSPIGRRVDESMPLCDARLADGSRVNIVLPPLALDGPTITIRKFMAKALGLHELVPLNSLSQEMADFLRACVLLRKNIVVAGGTGSGKTTLLNALSGLIPDDERIVTVEDAAELRLQKPHVVRLESRPPNAEGEGAIPIRRLVINALRMRPDRIVVGECRGGEALDMLQAMNTGHDGSLTTLHANTPRDALRRLETLVLMAGMDLPVRVVREQIQSAVHILIQQTRLSDGSRKITSITELTGMEGDTLTTQEIFRFRSTNKDTEGRHQGRFENTGMVPSFAQEMKPLLIAI